MICAICVNLRLYFACEISRPNLRHLPSQRSLRSFPPPSALVERWYAKGIYPAIQARVTAASNAIGLALFDTAILIFIALLDRRVGVVDQARAQAALVPSGRARRRVARSPARRSSISGFSRPGASTTRGRRSNRCCAFDASRVTPLAVRALAERAVREANRTHAAAHAAGFPAIADAPPPLVGALHEVERELGRPRPTVLAQPKRSLLSPFFRASGVSGMLGPFFLETLLNPDLTGPERPVVLAHEWAHLSGYAPESDASFVGFLAALRADPRVAIQRVARAGVRGGQSTAAGHAAPRA